jgi:serine phosphatase RsbU (regulator of sigma subunit)
VTETGRPATRLHPVVEVSYLPRVVCGGLGALITASTMGGHPKALIVAVVVLGVAWPQLAQRIAVRSDDQKLAGYRNLVVDGFVIGVFAGLTGFSPLATGTLVISLSAFEMMMGGFRFLRRGVAAMIVGMVVSLPVVGFHPIYHPSLLTTNLCLVFIAGAWWTSSYYVNRTTKDLVATRRDLRATNSRIRDQSQLLELAVAESIEINEVARTVNATLDLDEVLHMVLRSLRKIFVFDQVGTLMLDSSGQHLILDRLMGPGTTPELAQKLKGTAIPVTASDSIFARVMSSREPVYINEINDERLARMDPVDREIHRINPMRAILLCPLEIQEDIVGSLFLGSDHLAFDFSEQDLLTIEQYVTHVATAISNARLFGEAQRARKLAERELEIGREIQTEFLPADLPKLDGWSLAARLHSARQVSGDFYDVFPVEGGRVAVVVADVCDKGVGAALFMALFRSLFRAASERTAVNGTPLPGSALSFANDYIAITHDRANMFATAFFGVIDPATGELEYANAGHDPALIIGSEGSVVQLPPTGPAVGLVPGSVCTVERTTLDPGDTLLAYTDGVPEAMAADGSQYTEERLMELVRTGSGSPEDLLDRIESDVERHTHGVGRSDDVTLLAVQRLVRPTNPEPQGESP